MTTTPIDQWAGLACPSWCTADHARELVLQLGETTRVHRGPRFGPWTAEAEEMLEAPGPLSCMIQGEVDIDTPRPSVLLDLATAAIAAAQWLEAHR